MSHWSNVSCVSNAGISCLFQLVQTVASLLQVNICATHQITQKLTNWFTSVNSHLHPIPPTNRLHNSCTQRISSPSVRVWLRNRLTRASPEPRENWKKNAGALLETKKRGFRRDSNHTKSPSISPNSLNMYIYQTFLLRTTMWAQFGWNIENMLLPLNHSSTGFLLEVFLVPHTRISTF